MTNFETVKVIIEKIKGNIEVVEKSNCAGDGLYKEAIVFLRQFIEHMLFAVLLSTNDYSYRLWKNGQYGMSWSQIVDAQKGVFGKEFIEVYANDIGKEKSIPTS